MKRVTVDRPMRLAIPGHPAAELFVEIGDGAGACLEHAAPHHHPVWVEAVHVHVTRGPSLEVRAVLLGKRPFRGHTRRSEIGEVLALCDPDSSAFEDRAVFGRTDKAYRLSQSIECLDAGLPAGRDAVPTIPRQPDAAKLASHG